MAWVAIESVRSGATSKVILAYGLGSVALGALVAVLLRRFGNTTFFLSTRTSVPDGTSIPREQLL